jgi:hypothetical protein
VSVQLQYEGGPDPGDTVFAAARKPLGGWKVEASRVPQRGVPGEPDEDPVVEAVERTDVGGVAVFWLEQPGPYRFSSDDSRDPAAYCWWTGSALWEGDTPEVLLELLVGCT